ncbi:MAG: alpha/beta hydrolase [Planctomycetota bacterium]
MPGDNGARPTIATNLAPVLLALALGGCVARTPADPGRALTAPPAALAASDWPSRSVRPYRPVSGDEPGPCLFAGGPEKMRVRFDRRPVETECEGRYGTGCVHSLRYPEELQAEAASFRHEFEVLVFGSWRLRPVEIVTKSSVSQLSFSERMDTLVFIHTAARESPRGLVIHLTSIAGLNRQEATVVEALRDRGWAVVSIVSPRVDRFPSNAVHLDLADGIEACGSTLAVELDDRIAEWVYAIEAMVAYLRQRRSDIPLHPLVVVGCSAGALQLPALAARHPGAIDAAVLVGGGADFIDVIRNTDLPDDFLRDRVGFSVRWTGRAPNRQQWDAIQAEYLSRSRLDPYHSARYLSATPVLMLHARHDAIVPARSGERLYQQLGRPERWTYGLGHVGLFWWLPNEAARIADWIDQVVDDEMAPIAATMPDAPEENASP